MSSAAFSFEDGVTVALLSLQPHRAELLHQSASHPGALQAAEEQMPVWLLASLHAAGRRGAQRCHSKPSVVTASPGPAARAEILLADGQNHRLLCFAFGPTALLQLPPNPSLHPGANSLTVILQKRWSDFAGTESEAGHGLQADNSLESVA